MAHIKILREEANDDIMEVSGKFTEFPDWTFDAEVLPEMKNIDSDKYWSMYFDRIEGNDCWLCDFGRVISITLNQKGETYYTCVLPP